MHYSIMYAALFFAILFGACKNPSGEALEAAEAKAAISTNADVLRLPVSTSESVIEWEGSKPTNDAHTGQIRVKKGTLELKDGQLLGGQFIIDMHSILVTDLVGEKKANLEGHLKADDFFGVEEFPEATFTITNVSPTAEADANFLIQGNLAIRDSVKNIEIPAKLDFNETGVEVSTPSFSINRTDWGIVYNSGIIGTIKDKLINDEINLQISLKAKS